jgi:hypothetical protein
MHYKAPDNSIHFLESTDYEHRLPAGSVQITDAEAEELRPKPAELTYAQKRAIAYPSVNDYLDGIVKGDAAQVQAYIDACLAVKAQIPKS